MARARPTRPKPRLQPALTKGSKLTEEEAAVYDAVHARTKGVCQHRGTKHTAHGDVDCPVVRRRIKKRRAKGVPQAIIPGAVAGTGSVAPAGEVDAAISDRSGWALAQAEEALLAYRAAASRWRGTGGARIEAEGRRVALARLAEVISLERTDAVRLERQAVFRERVQVAELARADAGAPGKSLVDLTDQVFARLDRLEAAMAKARRKGTPR